MVVIGVDLDMAHGRRKLGGEKGQNFEAVDLLRETQTQSYKG